MPMLTTLNVPAKLPRWATNGAYTDEPLESNKLDGFKPGFKAPAVWWNWLQNLNYEWAKKIMSPSLMNWFENTTLGAATFVRQAIFHPAIGIWMVGAGAATRNSVDGNTWAAGNALPATTVKQSNAAIDTTKYIVSCGSTSIAHSADAGQTAWASVASATIGGSGNIDTIYTKYPDSDYTAISRGTGASLSVRIAASGITGSWVAAGTQPPSMPAASNGRALVYVGGSTWLLLVAGTAGDETVLYKSLNDGDIWVAVPGLVFPVASTGGEHIAYNRTAERLVVVGSVATSGSEEYIAYSDDLGDTWTVSTINKNGLPLWSSLYRVYYCGGSTWVAVGDTLSIANAHTVFVSTDDAKNWYLADIRAATSATAEVLACDGQRVFGFGPSGTYINTLAI